MQESREKTLPRHANICFVGSSLAPSRSRFLRVRRFPVSTGRWKERMKEAPKAFCFLEKRSFGATHFSGRSTFSNPLGLLSIMINPLYKGS